tara:strand:+ start:109 stop:318 length:210 start_codon:yes stop_codon:yes gene_type:complete
MLLLYGIITLTIYDMMVRQVKAIVNGSQTSGYRRKEVNEGKPVSTRLYFYTIQAGKGNGKYNNCFNINN